jgi:predicted AAA+ superfamily ATPase
MDDKTKTFVINSLAETPKLIEETLKNVRHERFFLKEIRNAMVTSGQRILIIAGLRGTGKTTSLYQLFGNDKSTAYLSCDELLSQKIKLEDVISALDLIKKQNIGMEKRFLLLLDEITYLDNWDLLLKVISDKRPNLLIVATSSSALPLKKNKELTRRAYDIAALPLSFREYLALKYEIIVPNELAKKIRKKLGKESLESEYISVRSKLGNHNLFGLYEEYIRHDLPSALLLSEFAYERAVRKTLKRTIYEDFSKYERFESQLLVAADKLINYLSTIPAEGVKITTLSEVSEVSKESVVKILETFELAMLVKGIEYGGRNRRFKKPKKWFFHSSSIRYLLAHHVMNDAELIGNLREDSVFMHLYPIMDSISYSHEADFIADGIKFEVGKDKKPRPGVIILSMNEVISVDRIPIPLFALSV